MTLLKRLYYSFLILLFIPVIFVYCALFDVWINGTIDNSSWVPWEPE